LRNKKTKEWHKKIGIFIFSIVINERFHLNSISFFIGFQNKAWRDKIKRFRKANEAK